MNDREETIPAPATDSLLRIVQQTLQKAGYTMVHRWHFQARNYRKILGINFFTGTPEHAAELGLRGGLVVVPAAPALVDLVQDKHYRESLLNSDLAITDSGLMVLLWNVIRGEIITRVSGLEYLKLILKDPSFKKPHGVCWIMPTKSAMERNVAWLNTQGIPASVEDCYLAPHYRGGSIVDEELLAMINKRQPAQIVVGLGGGTQEKLGSYLKTHANYRPSIHCIGAAIGFLSGDQVNIPPWADRYFLGWLFRCIDEPRKFCPRYWKARKLLALMLKYKESLPAMPAH